MLKNLVIVESPAKAKTIEKFLGKDYKVVSSFGHIRDLKKKSFSVEIENHFKPIYEVPEEKAKLVSELKKEAKDAEVIWLASDEDREGEAISWHLYDTLNLKKKETKRIVFHEITKPAILHAIETPREIDYNLVDAQQARRVLDRIVGFELSPILWRKIKPSLSAGRVQSVTVRLVVEREKEINLFKEEASYVVTATFSFTDEEKKKCSFGAELNKRFKREEEAEEFLKHCKDASYSIVKIETKEHKRSPAPPFTTSTLQQEASRKLGFSVSQTMSIAQKLYEAGKITYMRTDSVNLSSLALSTAKEEIIKEFGEKYSKVRNYQTHSKGAQEAHEAIRPTYMNQKTISGSSAEQKLYQLIWKRTMASQMSDAQMEKTSAYINISGREEMFVATGEMIKFDGFLRLYKESLDDEKESEEGSMLPPLKKGQPLLYEEIMAKQHFTQHPPRYTEASLVKKLEELGIGRPSTYAPTISTIQQREYVVKESREGVERKCNILYLKKGEIAHRVKMEKTGTEKNKLFPTDIGIVVNDFLVESFPWIMNYDFTADVEKEFDSIAEGKMKWVSMMEKFYDTFHPLVENIGGTPTEKRVGERLLGIDPKTNREVYVKIGRFGPIVQIGKKEDEEKPLFASIPKNLSMNDLTLEQALKIFSMNEPLGQYEGLDIKVGSGRFGPYIQHNKVFISIPKDIDPSQITLEDAIKLIEEKRLKEKEKFIQHFDEEGGIEVLNGRFGPYIAYGGKNYKIPKEKNPSTLTLKECLDIIKSTPEKKKRGK
ncbi:MAG TPA: type I DNA topoisomerase [Porphyromonadaceae bacterium]|nr:type I DNA topoisomerase [Porphyromonadaceae bacterium]